MEKRSRLETSFSLKGRLVSPEKNVFKHGKREVGMGGVLVGHECLVFGGYNGPDETHCVYKYDTLKKHWMSVLPKNENARFGSVRLTYINDDVLYAYIWNNEFERYMFVSLDLILMDEWVPAEKRGCAQNGFGAVGCYVEVRNEAVLYGGKKGSTDVHVYSVQRSSWYSPKASGQPPSPRINQGVCCTGREVFVIGGETVFGPRNYRSPTLLDIHILSIERQRFSWSSPVTTGFPPRGRHLFTTLCVGDRIFLYGGYNAYDSFEIYSIKEKRWYHASLEAGNEQEGKVRFDSEVPSGNCDNAAVVCQDKLLLIGGRRVDLSTPFEIVPSFSED